MNFTKYKNELKKNSFLINITLFLFLLYPVSIVLGPALIEITIFFSSIFLFYLIIYKNFSLPINYLNKYFLIILIFILICIISSLLSENILHSLRSSFFSIRFIFYVFVILFLLQYSKIVGKLFLYIALTFFLICLADSIVQIIFGKNFFLYPTNFNKITGLFFEEKKLGRYIISLSPILVGLYLFFSNRKLQQKIYICFIFLNIVFLISLFTSERVSMFYSAFTILILSIFGSKFDKKFLISFFLPIILLGLVYQLNFYQFKDQVKNTYKQITNNKTEFSYPSTQHRAFINTSVELFKKNPIIGVGPNNYRNSCGEVRIKEITNCSTHPHNILFQLLSETGILGVIIYIYFILIIIFKIAGFIFNRNLKDISIFFLLPVIYFLNPFFPSGNFFNNWFMAVGTFGIPFYLYMNDKKY